MNRTTVAGLLGCIAALSSGLALGQADASPAPTEAIAVSDLPSVADVMALHVEGIGGEEAVRAVTSRRFVGRVSIFVQGQEDPVQVGRLEVTAKAPDTFVQEMVFPGQASVRTIVQDGVVWQVNEADEVSSVDDEATASRQRIAAQFYQLADWETLFADLTVRGGMSQGDRRVVQLNATHTDDREEVYTFDLDTGLLLLVTGERASPVDPSQMVPFRRAYEDYREVSGVQYPHRVVEQAGPVLFEIKISSIEVGIDVPTFDVPDLASGD